METGIDDEAIEVQVGRGRTKLEVEHHVGSGHAQIELGVIGA